MKTLAKEHPKKEHPKNTRQGAPDDIPPSQWGKDDTKMMSRKERSIRTIRIRRYSISCLDFRRGA